jgi:hypothetical protein
VTIAEMVAASRAAQGLPPTIEDAGAIARVAAILRANHKVGVVVDASAGRAGHHHGPALARSDPKAAA